MNLNNFLPGIAFALLFLLMLLYWLQAAFFGQERYKALNNFISLLSLTSLTLLLTLRWIESGHFPLSNLYESLLFLSWCFLALKTVLAFDTNSAKKGFSPIGPRVRTNPFAYFCPKGMDSKAKPMQNTYALGSDASSLLALAKRSFTRVKVHEASKFSKAEQDSSLGLGVVLSPLALLTFGFAFLSLPKEMQKSTALVPALQSNWLMMHVTVMLLSYAALLSGSVLSIVFLILSSLEGGKHHLALPRTSFTGDDPYKSKICMPTVQVKGTAYNSSCKIKALMELPNSQEVKEGFTSVHTDLPTNSYPTALNSLSTPTPKDNVSNSLAFSQNELTRNSSRALDSNEDAFSNHARDSEQMWAREKPTGTALSLTDKLDNYSYRVLALGFPLLTIGILSGAVWANEAWGSYWSWDPKETWALITWLVFAIYLHTRITRGWSGKKSAVVASTGFFVVWFCYLGVNLLGTGLHSYGWFSK